MNLPRPEQYASWQSWASKLVQVLTQPTQLLPPQLPIYDLTNLPKAAKQGQLILVVDSPDNPAVAYSDGADWRYVMDGEVVA